MPDYKNGKIYRIVCNITGECYYGSTTQKLCVRLSDHKNTKKNSTSKQIIDRGNYSIVLEEDCPCDNKEQLERREKYYIQNNVCVNKNIPLRNNKEYRLDNLEHCKNRNKEYYKNNIIKIDERRRQRITCECGSVTSRGDITKHYKSQKHIDFKNI
jgi:hypothetical protein